MAERPDAAPAESLDRTKFSEDFETVALRVPARRTGLFLKELKDHLLNLPRRKNVEPSPAEEGRAGRANVVLLSRSLAGTEQLPPEKREWLEKQTAGGEVSVTKFQVHLDYEYLSTEQVLAKILPEGVEIPTSFEQAGHICHLNLRDSQLPFRFLIAQVLLDKNKSLRTVVNKVGKIETEFRTFPMEHLAGDEETVVKLREQGCTFEFDLREVYWNSRLQMEHGRLIDALFFRKVLDLHGKRPVVADATCGVGPFSVPMVKQAKQLVAHANDLNPRSVHWLRRNAEANKLPGVLHVETAPPFQDAYAPPVEGAKLVIHAPNDAREFIRSLCHQGHPVTHAIFNLPAVGVDLLDCYRGLRYEEAGLPRPLVSCYSFEDGPLERAPGGLLERLTRVLGLGPTELRLAQDAAFPSPQVDEMLLATAADGAVAVRFVRNVSPQRNMFCVAFQVPRACAGAERQQQTPAEKRPRTE